MPIKAIVAGKIVGDTAAELKWLFALVGANIYSTFEDSLGSDYTVTAGKILYICHVYKSSTQANNGIILGYGDIGVQDSAAAPTNPVTLSAWMRGVTAYVPYEYQSFIPIIAGKLPYVQSSTIGLAVNIACIEV